MEAPGDDGFLGDYRKPLETNLDIDEDRYVFSNDF